MTPQAGRVGATAVPGILDSLYRRLAFAFIRKRMYKVRWLERPLLGDAVRVL
jgi:hypothetical protein